MSTGFSKSNNKFSKSIQEDKFSIQHNDRVGLITAACSKLRAIYVHRELMIAIASATDFARINLHLACTNRRV